MKLIGIMRRWVQYLSRSYAGYFNVYVKEEGPITVRSRKLRYMGSVVLLAVLENRIGRPKLQLNQARLLFGLCGRGTPVSMSNS